MLVKHVLLNWMHIKSDNNLTEKLSKSEEKLNIMMIKLPAKWATRWMKMSRKTHYFVHEYKFRMIQNTNCEETIQIERKWMSPISEQFVCEAHLFALNGCIMQKLEIHNYN